MTVHKLIGSQFRSRGYQLKYSEVYKVPCASPLAGRHQPYIHNHYDDSDSSDEASLASRPTQCHDDNSELENYLQEEGLVNEDYSESQQLEHSDEPSSYTMDIPVPTPPVPNTRPSTRNNYRQPSGETTTLMSNRPGLDLPAANTRAYARRRLMEPHSISNPTSDVTELNQRVPNSRTKNRPAWMKSNEWEF